MTAAFANQSTIGVLLLGATGSLGSRILWALLERPFINVTAVVRNRNKLKEATSHHQQPCRQISGTAPPSPRERLSIIEGSATDSGLFARLIQEREIRVLVNAAGHAPMFARNGSGTVADGENKAQSIDNEVACIVRASIDAVHEVGGSGTGGTSDLKMRGWFIGGMLLLDLPGTKPVAGSDQKAQTLDEYLPLYLHHRPLEAMLRSSEYLDWTLVCPAKMVPRSGVSNVPTSSASPGYEDTPTPTGKDMHSRVLPALFASSNVPPKWEIWPFFRRIPWGIGPLLEIIANSARYTVSFEDVAEFIVDGIVQDHLSQEQQKQGLLEVYQNDHNSDQVETQEPTVGQGRGSEISGERGAVWINTKIGLIAASGNN
ncbi:hypothetical protein LTS17_003758 [Exophiala oligosperma]